VFCALGVLFCSLWVFFYYFFFEGNFFFFFFFLCVFSAEESTGLITPEDVELNTQLNELGLPLSFQTNKEVCIQIHYFAECFSSFWILSQVRRILGV